MKVVVIGSPDLRNLNLANSKNDRTKLSSPHDLEKIPQKHGA